MQRCIAICFFTVLLSAAGSASGHPASELEAYVDGVVAAVMAEHAIPGLVISIVGDGGVLLSKGYGIADAEHEAAPDASATLFRIGSVTKTFTWIAVMQLAERKRIDLHVDVNEYLAELRIPPWQGRPLTLYDIMAHRAGFEETGARFLFETEENEVVPFRRWLELHAPARVRAPGEAVAYSNYAATLAGVIVENVSGMAYHEYLETHIFTPLGMTNTTVVEPLGEAHAAPSLPIDDTHDFSAGFVRQNGIRVDYGFEFISGIAPAGAGSSTADDMARYMLGLLNDTDAESPRLLDPETFVRMRERSYPGGERAAGFAHGLINGTANGYAYWGHGGITTTFSTTMLVWPALEFGVFISINQRDGAGAISRVPAMLQEYMFPASDDRARAVTRPAAVFAETDRTRPCGGPRAASCFDGDYITNRRAYTTLEKFDHLGRGSARVKIADNGDLVLTRGGDTSAWQPVGPLTFRNARSGALMAFEADAKGNVVRLNDPGGYDSFERMSFVETPRFLHIVLAVAGLFAVAALASGMREAGLRRGRRMLPADYAAVALACAVLLSLASFVTASGAQSFAPGWPPAALVSLVWLADVAAVLAFSLLAVAALSWKQFRTGATPLLYIAFACAGIAMIVTLHQWNLVGVPSY